MMSRILGAPLGGTIRGGHQVFEPTRVSLITPPNGGSGAGSDFSLIVVVALGEPNVPVTCCAKAAFPTAKKLEPAMTPRTSFRMPLASFIRFLLVSLTGLASARGGCDGWVPRSTSQEFQLPMSLRSTPHAVSRDDAESSPAPRSNQTIFGPPLKVRRRLAMSHI